MPKLYGIGEEAHICSTYNVDPQPGECPEHTQGWRGRAGGNSLKYPNALWCYEHRTWEDMGSLHDECEACEHERNTGETLTDAELEDYPSGARCDAHLTDDPDDI